MQELVIMLLIQVNNLQFVFIIVEAIVIFILQCYLILFLHHQLELTIMLCLVIHVPLPVGVSYGHNSYANAMQ